MTGGLTEIWALCDSKKYIQLQMHCTLDFLLMRNQQIQTSNKINSTIDARSIYASAMSTVFDVDFKKIQKDVFWGEKLQNLSDKLFKA